MVNMVTAICIGLAACCIVYAIGYFMGAGRKAADLAGWVKEQTQGYIKRYDEASRREYETEQRLFERIEQVSQLNEEITNLKKEIAHLTSSWEVKESAWNKSYADLTDRLSLATKAQESATARVVSLQDEIHHLRPLTLKLWDQSTHHLRAMLDTLVIANGGTPPFGTINLPDRSTPPPPSPSDPRNIRSYLEEEAESFLSEAAEHGLASTYTPPRMYEEDLVPQPEPSSLEFQPSLSDQQATVEH